MKRTDFQDACIILFTRFPVPGQAKTRLMPALGKDGAANLQKNMTEYTVKQAYRTGIPLQIRFTGGTAAQMRDWLGKGHEYAPQGEGDLGERMARAFDDAFAEGKKKALVIGCDCPDNRSANMLDAIQALRRAPCVIGPAADGGYYLVGLREPRPEMFCNVEWGTDSVLQQTLEKAGKYRLLPILRDIDEPDDIPSRISVIIPALNEKEFIGPAVESVWEAFNVEAIVVDGGSFDDTLEIASQKGARAIAGGFAGRASQMNYGARQATGDIFLFLHADSVLPPAWDCHVRHGMNQPRTILGYFNLSIDGSFAGKRWVEWGTNLRSRFLKRPYGDQGLFLRRDEFFKIGGFPDAPILEDVLLVKQAKMRGRIRCINGELITSGRRWMKYGAIRTTIMNQAVLLAAWLGEDLEALWSAYQAGQFPLYRFIKEKARKRDK